MTPDVLYPVPFQLNDVFFDPYGRVEGHFTDATVSVHLYTNGTKPWWRQNPPLKNSYVARMCDQVDRPRPGPGRVSGPMVGAQAPRPSKSFSRSSTSCAAVSAGTNGRSGASGFLTAVCGMLRPGDLAIDCGANVGDISARLLASRRRCHCL